MQGDYFLIIFLRVFLKLSLQQLIIELWRMKLRIRREVRFCEVNRASSHYHCLAMN